MGGNNIITNIWLIVREFLGVPRNYSGTSTSILGTYNYNCFWVITSQFTHHVYSKWFVRSWKN